jgi:hypothetical protein
MNRGVFIVRFMNGAPKALERFKHRIREVTLRAKGVSLKTTIAELASYLRGWRSYFGFCETPYVLIQILAEVIQKLDPKSRIILLQFVVQASPFRLIAPTFRFPGVSSCHLRLLVAHQAMTLSTRRVS